MKRYSIIELSRHENTPSQTFVDRRIAVIGDSSAHVKSRWNETVQKLHSNQKDRVPLWTDNEVEGTLIWTPPNSHFVYTAVIMKFVEVL